MQYFRLIIINFMKTVVALLLLSLSAAHLIPRPHSTNQPPPHYNLTRSQQMARLAAVAFCGQQCLESWTCKTASPLELTKILYIDQPVQKIHGYVGYRQDTNQIVASFRGSVDTQNWIQDANFQKLKYPDCADCLIHAGFYLGYLSIMEQVNPHLVSILKEHPTASMVTTGHSLGAAISAICAIATKVLYPQLKIEVHNFGQPRVGNQQLAQFMDAQMQGIYRVVHNKDIVPHLPPDLPGFNYHHAAHQIYFNEDMTIYKVCDDSGQDISCSNRFFPKFTSDDHDFYFIHISHTQC